MRKIIDFMLLLIWVVIAVPFTKSALVAAELRARQEATEREAVEVYQAFCDYYQRNKEFPDSGADRGFDTGTLDPLRRRGYYSGSLTSRLLNQRVDGYDSPDDRGPNQEFWLEFTLASDPASRWVIARSDDAPLGGGDWLDGVYALRGDRLEAL
jgi:hypothetical protein